MKSFIVMGCGRFGESCAKTLMELDNEVLVIDEDYDKIKNISNDVTTAIQCDIMDEMAMKEIGLSNFDVAIISIGSSLTAAIMGTMLAKEAGVKYILAKAPSLREGSILKKVGADKIIYPERDMAKRVAHNLTSKNILHKKYIIFLSSRLYCRYWNFTNSTRRLVDFTTGGEFRPALKNYKLYIHFHNYGNTLKNIVNIKLTVPKLP